MATTVASRHREGVPGGAPELPRGELPPQIVLYDGVCGLCHRVVAWLLSKDRDHRLWFAPLQGETAARLRMLHPEIPGDLDSVVLVAAGRVHLRSKAFLHGARYLGPPWRWVSWARWLPGPVLDPIYRLIARVRYRVWGRFETCRRPTTDDEDRFLP